MSVSKYLNHVTRKSEQELFEDIVVETIKLYGYDIWYLPRTIIETDFLFGEPNKSIFEQAVKIEALIPQAGDLGGDGFLMSKFGFRVNETVDFLISKKRFRELGIEGYIQPKPGDIIFVGDINEPYASFSNDFFEINNVLYDVPGFQFGKQYCYKLVCESFTFSHEKVRTGFDAIDQLEGRTLLPGVPVEASANNQTIKQKAATIVKWDTGNPFGDLDN